MDADFVGGLRFPWFQEMARPYVLMTITEEQIGFHLRYGLRHLFGGPWLVERQRIATVYPERRGLLSNVKIIERGGLAWKFWTSHPDDVVHALGECGYPVVADAPTSR